MAMPAAKTEPDELADLQKWLQLHKHEELFNEDGDVIDEILSMLSKDPSTRLGQRKIIYAGSQGIKPIEWKKLAVRKGGTANCMQTTGKLLDQIMQDNPKTVRIFSPDEFESNKLNAVLDHTNRNFHWDEFSNARGGRVIETLAEHQYQGSFRDIL
jgi:xylulose-5-phosphate/fructose-6-phosphate phosphoketolase